MTDDNVRRFPTIGRHLIDSATPAYAETEPETAQAPKTCPPCNQACAQGRHCPSRAPRPAEASTEVGADDDLCRPAFNRATLAVLLVSGTGMGAVIGWAVALRWPWPLPWL